MLVENPAAVRGSSLPFARVRAFWGNAGPIMSFRLAPFWNRLWHSGTTRRILSGGMWNVGGTVLARLLGLLTWMLVARQLGKESFGEFGVLQSTIATFVVFATFGLGQTALT